MLAFKKDQLIDEHLKKGSLKVAVYKELALNQPWEKTFETS